MPFLENVPDKEEILSVYNRIKPFIHRTPILTSRFINSFTGCDIYFKCENFQKAGAFKFRGAVNALLSLNEEEKRLGVITHSSGNHAGALSKAAQEMGIKAVIVMPNNAPEIKKSAVKQYGAEIVFCEPTIDSRESTTKELIKKYGMVLVHPFDNYTVIAGQSTAAMELLNDVDNLDFIITPIGGGGLNSGSCLAAKYFYPATKIIGAEPAGADDAYRSWKEKKLYPQNNPNTICDGLRTPLSTKTFSIIIENIENIFTVEDETTKEAMKLIMERMKIVVEPSSAIVLAAILENKEYFKNKRVGLILSGGNVDLKKLPF